MNTAKMLRSKPIEILLVEDDDADILLTKRALSNGKIFNSLNVVRDGVEALDYLRQAGKYIGVPRPDLILLDLNMPRMDGRETLAEIKQDKELHTIPVVVLTTSDSDRDILQSYDLYANCYITKPVDLEQFTSVVKAIKEFWFTVVKLPPQ